MVVGHAKLFKDVNHKLEVEYSKKHHNITTYKILAPKSMFEFLTLRTF